MTQYINRASYVLEIYVGHLTLQAIEDVLVPHLPTYWQHLQAVMEGTSFANAQQNVDANQVKGAIQACVHYFSKCFLPI